ncbi:hypothetical protein AB6A40_004406 [Gnathostoma spinigerum]|uniref:E3 ubiquitin-protein ligase UBR4 n=1 Tax=Gnathostoma spinigerum TaxID=75299 RepID=A0ABD6EEK0_9BILA
MDNADTLLFLSLSEYKDKNKLDYTLMSVFAVQLKQILIKRTRHFHSYIRRYFCDVEAFLSFLYNQVKMHPENNDVQLEFFLLTCCAYMAAKSPKTDEIAKLIADILFIEDIVLANRCKTWLSLIVSTYCCISQRSHQILFAGPHDQFPVIAMNEMSSSTTADISKSNKAIPSAGPSFLTPAIVDELSKALWNECEAKNERNLSSGKLTPLEAFNKENEWVGRLLVYLMQQLDVTMCRGMHCIAPAQTIVSLMSQHSASQLTQVVKFLISGLDFSSLQLAQTPESERHHLMLRLIGVILAQSTGRGAVKVDNTPEESVLTGEVDVDDAASETPVEASAEEATSGTSRSVVDDDNADEEEEESEREEVLATIQNETSSSSRDATPVRNEGTLITPEDTAHATTPVVITGVVSPYAELAHQMATQLKNFGAIEYCYNILDSLYLYWKSYSNDTERTKELPLSSISPECLPDLSPLFSDRVVAPSTNVFESLKALVTEVGLKLPYQMKKVLRSELELSEKWRTLLCQYISLDSSVNRRLARKLLLLICDSDKVRYRQVRDEYSIASVIRHLKETTSGRRSLEYMELSEVIQQLKSIQNTIEHHNNVWRKICQHELTWLLDLAAKLPDIASSAVLNLILSAVRTAEEESCDDQLCCALADILLGDNETFTVLRRLIARFLMGENEARRWMIHSLLRSALQLASRPYQLKFINYLYNIVWPQAIHMGRQGAQLVDLLAYYLPRFQNRDELKRVYEEASSFIDISYDMLSARKNSVILTKLSEVVGAPDESVISGCPCLICAERDEAHEPTKLSAIKLDSRFTTSAQMIKLMGHFEISHVIIRLADIKRSKMVKRVKLYYCNKTLESAVDLKNRSDLWEKAADIKVNQEETEIDIQLPIPIVTCNLVIEMAEFYETSASGEPGNPEVVHCPRCSTSVPPNPGICSNCGENVFQCVKCRAINYDEKEPFLCNSCGFCKYARLESTIVGRSMLSVQSIEDDADRKAVETQMKALLKDIESTRCELSIVHKFMEKCCWESDPGIRPSMLLQHVTSEALTQFMASMRLDEGVSLSSLYKLAETIQGELQGQTRQLIALRSEASRYDFEVNDSMNSEVLFATGCYSSSDQCVGCISTLVVHCITLIEAICSNNSLMEEIIGESFLFSRLVVGCSLGWKISQAVQSLMWNLSETSEEATYKICTLVEQGALPAHLLSKSILSGNFRFWEQKLRCLIRMSVAGSNETSEVDLHAISALLKLCFPKASLHRFDGLSATTSAFPCAPSAGKPDQAVRTKHIFSEEEGETMTCETREAPEALFDPASLSCKEDIVESGENTAANYRNESETISSLSQTISVPSTSAIQENGMDSVMDKDNSKVLPYASFLDQLTDKADGDSIPRVVELITSHTDKSLTQHWLRGDFLWSEYDEVVAMLKKDGSEDKVDCASSAISFIRSCCKCAENKESTEDIVDQWLTHCMFSPISSVRFATYRLLIALCYRLRDDGTYELGSPIDIAHVLKKALLWLDQVRKISADSIDEYFSFLRSLIAMPGMRQILTSQPILLHIDVVRRMAIESVDLKTAETKGIAGDLSLGRHAKLFLNILKTFLSNDETGWCLLVRSCQTLLPYILRTRSNFTVISLHRTSYVEECAADLDVLIIRIAMKCPILTLRNLVKYIHMNEDDLRVQTYLVKMISSIVHPVVKKDEDFLIQLDKHQLQEDYLQGRMCGNPYKSSDSGMGPLMRDVKNKICRDCELVSLLDDDNGMEVTVSFSSGFPSC